MPPSLGLSPIIGILLALFGASGLFGQLQNALNTDLGRKSNTWGRNSGIYPLSFSILRHGGRLLVPWLEAGYDVDGCDVSADMVARCRERATASGHDPFLAVQPLHPVILHSTNTQIDIHTYARQAAISNRHSRPGSLR